MTKDKYGLTLIEMTVVIGIIALLAIIGLPAIKALQNSFADKCSKRMISSLLSSARAVAAQKRSYTGVRFQRRDDTQYAVLVIRAPKIPYPDDVTTPFIALKNRQPINLGKVRAIKSGDNNKVTVIFSPSGKLIRKRVMLFSNPEVTNDDIFGYSGLFPEDKISQLSNNSFVIYKAKEAGDPNDLKLLYVNTYTGRIIE